MTFRGRGLLEVKKSNNPFFHTTSSDIGVSLQALQEKREKMLLEQTLASSTEVQPKVPSIEGNFGFLYSRESDTIGSRVQKPSTENKLISLTKADLALRRHKAISEQGYSATQEYRKPTEEDVLRVLKVFNQGTKEEDPRYTTSNNEYGKKAPTIATYVSERCFKTQNFSKSFLGVKPKNSSLNTGLSRSTVHPSLDPQFA